MTINYLYHQVIRAVQQRFDDVHRKQLDVRCWCQHPSYDRTALGKAEHHIISIWWMAVVFLVRAAGTKKRNDVVELRLCTKSNAMLYNKIHLLRLLLQITLLVAQTMTITAQRKSPIILQSLVSAEWRIPGIASFSLRSVLCWSDNPSEDITLSLLIFPYIVNISANMHAIQYILRRHPSLIKITQLCYLIMTLLCSEGSAEEDQLRTDLHYKRFTVITSRSSVNDCVNELCSELLDGTGEVYIVVNDWHHFMELSVDVINTLTNAANCFSCITKYWDKYQVNLHGKRKSNLQDSIRIYVANTKNCHI